MWTVAREVSFFVAVKTFPGRASLIPGALRSLRHVPSGGSPSELFCPVYIHWNRDVVIASGGV